MTRRYASLPCLVLSLLALGTPGARADESRNSPPSPGLRLESIAIGVDLDRFDGSMRAPRATAAVWRQIAHQLEHGGRAGEIEIDLPRLRARVAEWERRGTIALGVIDLPPANRTARASGRRIFAFSALAGETHRGESVVFQLAPEDLVTRRGERRDLEADFDDGRGFRPLVAGVPVAVSYAKTGRKTIRLRARAADGTLLHAAAAFSVRSLETPDPHDTLRVVASEPYQGATGAGSAYVYRAEGRDSLVNPVVVIEGFDIENDMGWDELYALLNQENLVERLRAEGFDLVVLDFDDATEPLQRNAFLVSELVQQIVARIDPGADLFLVGASMGGLVCRYGLAWLEDRGVDPRVRSFLSYDAPHRGANIPLGIQYWLEFFQEESSDAEFLLSRLDRPAARQMLVYHHTDPPGATGEPDPSRLEFLADLAALGEYPTGPRLLAAANGSGSGLGQGFAPGEQIVRYEHDGAFVDVRGNVWAVPDGPSTTIFDGLFEVFGSGETRQVTVSGTLPYDDAPGGWRPSMTQMDTTEAPVGDIEALHPAHCFIPTVSALDLDVAGLRHDVAADPDPLSRTPFDAIHFPAGNQEHVVIDSAAAVWILAEVRGPVVSVDGPGRGSGLSMRPPAPNPASGSTRLRFRLETPARVTVAIHDLRGRRVRLLHRGALAAGAHAFRWDGVLDGGARARAGIYFGRVTTDGASATARLAWIP